MAADGSIIIDTRIQTEGLSKGLNTIKAGMTRITAQVSKMGETAKIHFKGRLQQLTAFIKAMKSRKEKLLN